MEGETLKGKTVVITGGNSGIGKATAVGVAKQGAHVILACRNEERAAAAREDIVRESGNQDVVVTILDLASLKSVRQFAQNINENESRLDILINNAGLAMDERHVTEDGFEFTFQANHLGHFLLTNLLLEKIKASAPSKIINLASVAHKLEGELDMSDLQTERCWSLVKSYGRSKTMNILFTVELAKRLKGTGVNTYAVHPGVVKTNLGKNTKLAQNNCVKCCLAPCLMAFPCVKTPVDGAATTLYCALNPAAQDQTGLYYADCRVASAKSYATDPLIALELWDKSAVLCGIDSEQKVQ